MESTALPIRFRPFRLGSTMHWHVHLLEPTFTFANPSSLLHRLPFGKLDHQHIRTRFL